MSFRALWKNSGDGFPKTSAFTSQAYCNRRTGRHWNKDRLLRSPSKSALSCLMYLQSLHVNPDIKFQTIHLLVVSPIKRETYTSQQFTFSKKMHYIYFTLCHWVLLICFNRLVPLAQREKHRFLQACKDPECLIQVLIGELFSRISNNHTVGVGLVHTVKLWEKSCRGQRRETSPCLVEMHLEILAYIKLWRRRWMDFHCGPSWWHKNVSLSVLDITLVYQWL